MNLILIQPHEPDGEGRICLSDYRAEHIRHVLKAELGKTLRIGLLNGPKGTGTVEKVCCKEILLRCEFEEKIPPRPNVELLLALPRPKVMKRLWAQLAALGVRRIILTNAEKVERCYFDSHVLDPDFYTARLIEGLQQAGDTNLPEVQIVRQLKPFLEDELDADFPNIGPEHSERGPDAFAVGQRPQGVAKKLLADPSGEFNLFQTLENKKPQRCCLAIGPEGGWTPYELELFTAHGFQVFNAGSRILRTDTACIALLSLLTLLSGANEK
ncbi:MAG: RsmE family RNA methyltransferase [Kiritimatiellales bacterium]